MNIQEKIDKYLVDESKKNDEKKLINTIRSINSTKQIPAAVNMIVNFVNKYGMSWFQKAFMKVFNPSKSFGFDYAIAGDKLDFSRKYIEKIGHQLDKMSHEGKITKDEAQKIKSQIKMNIDKFL